MYVVSLNDHFMIYCIRKFNEAGEKGHKMIKTRKMKGFDEQAFLSYVSSIFWERIFDKTDNVNTLVSNSSSIFSFTVDKHAPLVEMWVSDKYYLRINRDLNKLIQTRERLKRLLLKGSLHIFLD